jgi:type VI secretion system protein ImpH
LIERVFSEGHRFDFFQAVRVLEHFRRNRQIGGDGQDAGLRTTGDSHPHEPDQEAVRFRNSAGLRFPAGAIQRVDPGEPTSDSGSSLPQMFVTMMGLTGPSGVLPEHYTQLLMQRSKYGDRVLSEFLEVFHHRTVSLFYQAWQKYHLPVCYEQSRTSSDEDMFTGCLRSLVGIGTAHQQDRLDFPDEVVLDYSGHFADSARSANRLEDLLTDFFGFSVEVRQFQGRWLYLDDDDYSRLASSQFGRAAHAVLGVDFVVGGRVWDVQGRLRLTLGPLDYPQYCRLLPGGGDCRVLGQLTRLYIGPEYEFDVQPILARDQIPRLRLSSRASQPARLGWNTWLFAETPEANAEDVIFNLDAN